MTAVLAPLVALAVLLVAGPTGRRASRCRAEPRRRVAPVGRTARGPSRGGASRRGAQGGSGDLAAVVTTVSTLLRAGARPAEAWARALRLPACGAVPTVAWARALRLPACGAVPTVEQLLNGAAPATRGGRRRRVPPGERARAQAVVAAAVVAQQLGAPLAAVLDEVAAAVVADAEAEAELAAALAGPRASVRVLLGLPVLGVLLGAAAGANPVAVLLDRGLGTAAGVLGCGLAAAGWGWTRLLVGRARGAAAS